MPAIDNPESVAQSLPGQLADLRKKQKDTNTAIIASFTTQLAALTAVVAAQAVSTANQVSPAVGSAQLSPFVLTTSYQTLAQFNLTVPTGYTRALISASSFIAQLSNYSSATDVLRATTFINGTAGFEGVWDNVSAVFGVVASYCSVSLSGLTGGQTIPVLVQGKLDHGPGANTFSNSSISAIAMFLK
jgi:hypothetical protein